MQCMKFCNLYNAITEILRRNEDRRQIKLTIGDRVFVHNSVVQEPHGKFSPTYVGPYKVVEFKPPASYSVKNLTSQKSCLLHKDKLLPAGHIFLVETSNASGMKTNGQGKRKNRKSKNISELDRILRSMNKIYFFGKCTGDYFKLTISLDLILFY